MEFFGHVFSNDGLRLAPHKVRAVKECQTTKDKEAVRSVPGMAGYLKIFTSNNATIAAPLYELTRKETKFH